jgi:cardiolipin synthase
MEFVALSEHTPLLLTAAAAILDLYAIGRALWRGHGVESTIAWILGIVAFPVVGALAYIALANPGITRTARLKRARSSRPPGPDSMDDVGTQGMPGALTPAAGSVAAMTTALTGLSPTSGNRVELLAADGSAFRRIEEAIAGAGRRIWAEYYIIRNDRTGHRFLDLLSAKAREGVEVRLLYDAVGSLRIDAGRLAAIRAAGGRTEAFLPVNPLRRRWAVHLRNHRKLILVDGEVGFTGGMNVGDEYSGRARLKGARLFRDSHLCLRGPCLVALAQVFADDWSFATDEALEACPPPEVQGVHGSVVAVVPSGPDQPSPAAGLTYFAAVTGARERAWIASPYFVPDEPMLRALASAALRGVDVRIMVPRDCDVRLVGAAARRYYRRLLESGVRVFEYLPSMLHAKTMVVDRSLSWMGSANMDIRSFRLNFELGTLVEDPAFAADLATRFEADLLESSEVRLADVDAWSEARRLGNGLAWLLSPLL